MMRDCNAKYLKMIVGVYVFAFVSFSLDARTVLNDTVFNKSFTDLTTRVNCKV